MTISLLGYQAGSAAYGSWGQTGTMNSTGGSSGGGGMNWGGLMGFAGSYMQGFGRNEEIKSLGRQMAFNEETAKILAAEAEREASWQISRSLLAGHKMLAQTQFLFGFGGMTLEGTPGDVLVEMEQEMELDRRQIWREGQMTKKYQLAAAKQYHKAAESAKKGGIFNALGTSFSAVTSLVGMGG